MSSLAQDLLTGGPELLLRIFVVLMPIVIGLDLLRTYGVLARIRGPLEPVLRFLGLRPQAAEPFLTGVGFGMVFGAGVILARERQHELTRRDLSILACVLVTAHALPEDTFIFVSIGANGLLILAARLTLMVAGTFAVRLFVRDGKVELWEPMKKA